VKYIVRLNQRAYNPLTSKVDPKRVWEIEQCADRDSEKVIWHCAEVRIGEKFIRELFVLPKKGEKATELTFWGICTIGQDNAFVIDERKHDVQ
jgi:hypothetical protein